MAQFAYWIVDVGFVLYVKKHYRQYLTRKIGIRLHYYRLHGIWYCSLTSVDRQI